MKTLAQKQFRVFYIQMLLSFDSGNNFQKVELVTLIKDAVFYLSKSWTILQEFIETLTFDVDGDGTVDETTLQGRFSRR